MVGQSFDDFKVHYENHAIFTLWSHTRGNSLLYTAVPDSSWPTKSMTSLKMNVFYVHAKFGVSCVGQQSAPAGQSLVPWHEMPTQTIFHLRVDNNVFYFTPKFHSAMQIRYWVDSSSRNNPSRKPIDLGGWKLGFATHIDRLAWKNSFSVLQEAMRNISHGC